jgi:hypothetical protein
VPVEENVEERWLRIGEPSGVTITIGGGNDPFNDGLDFVDFPVSIVGEGLEAKTWVRSAERSSQGRTLAEFFEGLAEDWKGEKGEPAWEAIEHDMGISVERDSFGHVLLAFELRQSYRRNAWSVRVVVKVEPGEEMSQVAAGVRRLLTVA